MSTPPSGVPAAGSPSSEIGAKVAGLGRVRDFLRVGGLGRTGEMNVFWRNLSLAIPGATADPPHGMTWACADPTEYLVADLLVPVGWSTPTKASVWITPESSHYEATGVEQHRLPFEGRVEHLGTDLARLRTRHAPMWGEILRGQLDRLGWLDTAFDIYRCEVRYPALHSAVHVCAE